MKQDGGCDRRSVYMFDRWEKMTIQNTFQHDYPI